MSKQAEKEFQKFAAVPLMKACGVDRASWIAGYETAREQREALLASVQKIAVLLDCVPMPAKGTREAMKIAWALIAKIKEEA